MKLTADQLRELAEYLQGTCRTVTDGLVACEFDELGVDPFEVEVELEQHHEMEICTGCGWWEETGVTDMFGQCPDCQQDDDDGDEEAEDDED